MIKKTNIHVYILQQKSGYIRIQFMLLAVKISRVLFYQSQHTSDVVSYVNIRQTLLPQTELEV